VREVWCELLMRKPEAYATVSDRYYPVVAGRAEPEAPPTPTPTPGPSLPARTPDLIDAALRDDEDEYGAVAVRPRALRRAAVTTAAASKPSSGMHSSPEVPSQATVASNVSAGTTASRRRGLSRVGTNNSYE
jgi:hypothetical protein